MKILYMKMTLCYYLLDCIKNPNTEDVDKSQVNKAAAYDSSVQKVKKLIRKISNPEMKDIFQTISRFQYLTRVFCIIKAAKEGITISEDKFYSELCDDFYSKIENNLELLICASNAQSMRNIFLSFECIYHFYLIKKSVLDSFSDLDLMHSFYKLFTDTKKIVFRKDLFIPIKIKRRRFIRIIKQGSIKLINFANKFKPFEQPYENYILELKKSLDIQLNIPQN